MKRKRNNYVSKTYPGGMVDDLPKVGAKTLLYADGHVTENVARSSSACNFVSLPTIVNGTAGIILGDSHSDRTSQRIRIKKIEAKLHAYMSTSPSTSARSQWQMNVHIYLDKQHNGANVAPTASDLYDTKGSEHLPNVSNRYRFKKLFSRQITVMSTPFYNGTVVQHWDGEGRADIDYSCDIPIMYDTTAGGGLERLTSNNVYIVLEPVGSVDPAAVEHVGGIVRLYYTS